ncbi:MAG: large-conductance mechanosensitive channel protein MscL [Dysgonamonadaceae bacterium]|jgi:large conductance mechanosensitive channel|nr:large-conductance mechanosensitive channel protein MscL [Dysgonamonadaceae bacterium]
MALVKELKEFLMRGNVVDMAVGIIIGGAFGKIVSSFVNDVLMPPLATLMGSTNFNDLSVVLKKAAVDAQGAEIPAIALNYGSFVQTIIDFLIIGTAIFFFIKGINSFQKKKVEETEAPAEPSNEEKLLAEIRDLLKKK